MGYWEILQALLGGLVTNSLSPTGSGLPKRVASSLVLGRIKQD